MTMDEKKVWKSAAKAATNTLEFKNLKRRYKRFSEMHGPGLHIAIPYQTYFVKDFAASAYLKAVTKNLSGE